LPLLRIYHVCERGFFDRDLQCMDIWGPNMNIAKSYKVLRLSETIITRRFRHQYFFQHLNWFHFLFDFTWAMIVYHSCRLHIFGKFS
jgi:hypothetical protein